MVRVVSAIEVTLRHHRVAFQAKMFVGHRRSPSELIAVASPARARFDKIQAGTILYLLGPLFDLRDDGPKP